MTVFAKVNKRIACYQFLAQPNSRCFESSLVSRESRIATYIVRHDVGYTDHIYKAVESGKESSPRYLLHTTTHLHTHAHVYIYIY